MPSNPTRRDNLLTASTPDRYNPNVACCSVAAEDGDGSSFSPAVRACLNELPGHDERTAVELPDGRVIMLPVAEYAGILELMRQMHAATVAGADDSETE